MRVADADEAVRLANEGPYGLQASVWTRDTQRGEELARRIEAGVACVNDAQVNYAALELPMGGWKASGLGSRHGPDGIRKYTKRQSILITPATAPSRELHMFPYSAQVTEMVGQTFALLATSDLFTDEQRRTLAVLCDTFVPSLDPPEGEADPTGFWSRSATDFGVPEAVEASLLQAEIPEEQKAGLRNMLDGLAGAGLAPEAPQEAREAIVHAVTDSSPEALAGVTAIRGLILSLHYMLPDLGTGRNPSWEAMGYPGPQRIPPDEPKPLAVRRPAATGEDLVIEADVCVIGSGAGGGVIAGTLAEQGKQVCVLEMGGYFNEADFNQLEVTGYQNLYLGGGPFRTVDGQVSIQAGSTLGGGTGVNWQNCLRTFPWVREEWAGEHGLEGLDGPDYDRCMDDVWERITVTDSCSELNGPHQRLKEGCEALDWDFQLITRNVDASRHDPDLAGFGGFGDVTGAKQSTQRTYLADAHGNGAELVVNCRADRIITEGGRAAGVEGTYLGPDGVTAKVTVRASQVVVACGSIESPALLLRSGRAHKTEMSRLQRTSGLIMLIRDHGHGRVGIDANGNAVPSYLMTDPLDQRNFRAGMQAVARVHEAAGAERMVALSHQQIEWNRGDDLEPFLSALESVSLEPWHFGVFSAHQMGSCRMGSDPATSVANPWGELHDTPGVWIGDASAFPSASGTNPMLTIMALARRTAGAMAAA
jgi:choline dehydrogenase-like flavoprotein